MRKRIILTLVTVALLSILVIPSISAKKSTSYVTVQGHLEYIPTILEHIDDGQNIYLSTTEIGCWYDDLDYGEGELIGYSENGPGTVILFDAEWPPTTGFRMKWYTAEAKFEFFTVNGKTGQVDMRLVGKLHAGDTEWSGHWVIVDASGQLEGITGSGTWWGPGWGALYQPGHIPFEGKVYFPS